MTWQEKKGGGLVCGWIGSLALLTTNSFNRMRTVGRDDGVEEGMLAHSDCHPHISWLKETMVLHPQCLCTS